jgi:hypothetical protein
MDSLVVDDANLSIEGLPVRVNRQSSCGCQRCRVHPRDFPRAYQQIFNVSGRAIQWRMPKNYTMGGRTPAGAPGDAPQVPQRQSWRERLGALRNLPPFLKLVWKTSPALASGQALLRLVRALLPVATLFVGKLIIDEVVLLVQAPRTAEDLRQWLSSGLLDRIGLLLALEFGLAVLSDVLGRAVSLLDSLLSERFSDETSLRLMEHAATLDLEDFEDSELQDRLERARRQAAGAYRAPRHCSCTGVRRRGALQCAELFAELRPFAATPRARLRPADGGQRRDGKGSEDLRPERISY